MMLWSR